MGLENSQKNYVHIVDVDVLTSRVKIRTYRNKASQLNPTSFDKHIDDSVTCGSLQELLDALPTPTLSIRDNLWVAAYKALKREPPYNQGDWIDVLEERPNTKIEITLE